MNRFGAAAELKSYQQGLPLPDLERDPVTVPPRAPAEAAENPAIHISRYEREGRDFYATPSWVTEALLRHVRLRGQVWEPCCGDGAMSTVLAAHR